AEVLRHERDGRNAFGRREPHRRVRGIFTRGFPEDAHDVGAAGIQRIDPPPGGGTSGGGGEGYRQDHSDSNFSGHCSYLAERNATRSASTPSAIVSSGTENENRRCPSPSGPTPSPGP